jgi:hypothetical protein
LSLPTQSVAAMGIFREEGRGKRVEGKGRR